MKKTLILALGSALILLGGCGTSTQSPASPGLENGMSLYYPSTDKTKLGTKIAGSADRAAADYQPDANKEYDLVERLRGTVWIQSEKEWDDGKLEEDSEYIAFGTNYDVTEWEVENGKKADDYEYTTIELVKEYDTTNNTNLVENGNRNAAIVKITETKQNGKKEVEYQGYYVKGDGSQANPYILYLADDKDTVAKAEEKLKQMLKSPSKAEDQYVLSVQPKF